MWLQSWLIKHIINEIHWTGTNNPTIVSLIFSNKIDFTGSLPIHRQSSSVNPLEEARTFWSGWSNSSGSIFRIFLGGTTLAPNSLAETGRCLESLINTYGYKPTYQLRTYLSAWNMTSIAGTTALATLFFTAFSIDSWYHKKIESVWAS